MYFTQMKKKKESHGGVALVIAREIQRLAREAWTEINGMIKNKSQDQEKILEFSPINMNLPKNLSDLSVIYYVKIQHYILPTLRRI